MYVGSYAHATKLSSLPMICLACNNQSNFSIEKEVEFTWLIFIPYLFVGYFATCGVCQSSFQLDKRKIKKLQKKLKAGENTLWSDGKIPNLKEFIDEKDYKRYLDNDGVKL